MTTSEPKMQSAINDRNLSNLNILIVDDHPLLLEGLSIALKRINPDTQTICAQSIEEAKHRVMQIKGLDLILLDLSLPDGKGLSLIRFLEDKQLFIPCIVISASEDLFDIKTSLKAGASGFISKSNGGEHIAKQISRVIDGEIVVPESYVPDHTAKNSHSEPLTPRQKEVLKLLAEGLPNKSICKQLALTEHTVKSHIKALFQALDVHSRTECVRVASLLGLID